MNPQQTPTTPGPSPGTGRRVNVADIYPASPAAAPPPVGGLGTPADSTSPSTGSPQEKKPKNKDGIKSVLSTIGLFLLAPIIALSLTAFAFQSYQVDGQSMETTLQNNDRLIVNKMPRTISKITKNPYIPKRGEIIVFNGGGLFDTGSTTDKQLIKRVIALPGEDIEVKGGKITVYNHQSPEGFDPDRAGIYAIAATTTPQEVERITLGPREIFVCGDNRANSEDSRYFGPIAADRIVGELIFRIYPLGKADKF